MSTRLYVGNLSFRTTKDSLRDAFSAEGREVTDVHIVLDRDSGQSRGFGFVTLATPAQAEDAISKMNGAMLDGRPL
ncbi:MAG: RNA recognition motif domain-containing protein, partial [Polyangiales bacterium]